MAGFLVGLFSILATWHVFLGVLDLVLLHLSPLVLWLVAIVLGNEHVLIGYNLVDYSMVFLEGV